MSNMLHLRYLWISYQVSHYSAGKKASDLRLEILTAQLFSVYVYNLVRRDLSIWKTPTWNLPQVSWSSSVWGSETVRQWGDGLVSRGGGGCRRSWSVAAGPRWAGADWAVSTEQFPTLRPEFFCFAGFRWSFTTRENILQNRILTCLGGRNM